MRFVTPTYDMLSKDGPFLQYIFVQERELSKSFKNTRQHLDADMLPHEAAQVIVDSLKADPQIRDFALLKNTPNQVGGRAGFKLVYTYRDHQGLAMQSIYYGTVNGSYFFNIRYTATQRHYFAADLDTFIKVVDSLLLAQPPA